MFKEFTYLLSNRYFSLLTVLSTYYRLWQTLYFGWKLQKNQLFPKHVCNYIFKFCDISGDRAKYLLSFSQYYISVLLSEPLYHA